MKYKNLSWSQLNSNIISLLIKKKFIQIVFLPKLGVLSLNLKRTKNIPTT